MGRKFLILIFVFDVFFLCSDAICKVEERLVVPVMEMGHVCFVHVAPRSNVTVFSLGDLDAM